jgi:hypothetical protein
MNRLLKFLFVSMICLAAFGAFAQNDLTPLQSTSGPRPGSGVVSAKVNATSKSIHSLSGVPAYIWRHGCGPTAMGMILGYWDAKGFSNLIPGDASTQTYYVNQAIASGGDDALSTATPPRHFEDYAMPIDYSPNMQRDAYIAASRAPHVDECLADFGDVSKSTRQNYYGWMWSNDVESAFAEYISLVSDSYAPTVVQYALSGIDAFTFDMLKTEIDAGRPMLFLVDSDGDGYTDHFVTAVGYDDGDPQMYLYHDTWDTEVHSAQFREISSEYAWGIARAWTVFLANPDAFSASINSSVYLWKQEGDPLSLNVTVNAAAGEVSYQWTKDGAEIQGATDAEYSVASVTEDDEGAYRCVVQDQSKAAQVAGPVYVQVIPSGALPASNIAALSVCLAALVCAGVARLARALR